MLICLVRFLLVGLGYVMLGCKNRPEIPGKESLTAILPFGGKIIIINFFFFLLLACVILCFCQEINKKPVLMAYKPNSLTFPSHSYRHKQVRQSR